LKISITKRAGGVSQSGPEFKPHHCGKKKKPARKMSSNSSPTKKEGGGRKKVEKVVEHLLSISKSLGSVPAPWGKNF
jgi:hypothetical protein